MRSDHDTQHGQGIDLLKSKVLVQAIGEAIAASVCPEVLASQQGIRLMDVGTGDGTTIRAILYDLESSGVLVSRIALVDPDEEILPELLRTVLLDDPIALEQRQVLMIQGDREYPIGPLPSPETVDTPDERFDAITATMVLHQVKTAAELLHVCMHMFLALKENGRLFITGLHPDYLAYLVKNESEKFHYDLPQRDNYHFGRLGTYHLDGGADITMVDRSFKELEILMSLCSMRVLPERIPSLDRVLDTHPRAKMLCQNHIPMFYILEVVPQPGMFVSFHEGVVKNIKIKNKESIVTYKDGDTVSVPGANGYMGIKSGDSVAFFTVDHVGIQGRVRHTTICVIPHNKQVEPIVSIMRYNVVEKTR